MSTWATENDINNFFNVVPPCGRGQSLQVLQYLQQKGISSSPITSSRASSVASSSAGSDVEERIFPHGARSPGTCAGRGMMLGNYDRDKILGFEGGRERWDNAVYNQLRRANKESYTTDLFEYQLKMLHKAQEDREKQGQFEEAAGDDDTSSVGTSASGIESASSVGTSASGIESASSSPSPSSVNSGKTKKDDETIDIEYKVKKDGETTDEEFNSKKDDETTFLEEETRKIQVMDYDVKHAKPTYKSVRSRNVLLNSLAKMSLVQNSFEDPVGGDQKGTEGSVEVSSSAATSDESENTSPLIFDSAAASPQPDLHDQINVSDGVYESRQYHDSVLLGEEIPSRNQLNINENITDSIMAPYCRDMSPDVDFVPDRCFKEKVDYPSVVGHFYDNHYDNKTKVNSDTEHYIFRANSKSCKYSPPSKSSKFTPPSVVGLQSLGYSPTKVNSYNVNFELKPEDFPPLK